MTALATSLPACDKPAPGRLRPAATIQPGEYQLTMVATAGSRHGSGVTGSLWLRPTTAADRSPVTGKDADDFPRRRPPLYGYTDVDLRAVGAPISIDALHPAPSSRDPVSPGVLLHAATWPSAPSSLLLTIASVGNLRDGVLRTDGAGIALWVLRLDETGFAGTWSEVGLVADGRGHFCATR